MIWILNRSAIVSVLAVTATPLYGSLPEGPGKHETEQLCQGCHDIAQSVSLRQDRNGWGATLMKMVGLGVKATDQELQTILAYLSEHFPADELPPVNVNKARAIQLESRLSLRRSEAAAILRYRKGTRRFQVPCRPARRPGHRYSEAGSQEGQVGFRLIRDRPKREPPNPP